MGNFLSPLSPVQPGVVEVKEALGPSQFDLELYRTGERYRGKEGAQGIRGILHINATSPHQSFCYTVERGDGYKHLPPGEYDCEFGFWTHKGVRIKAIRVLGEYSRGNHPESRGRIYFHPANWPHQLEGCIACGLEPSSTGVQKSRDCYVALFEELGGWEQYKPLKLLVHPSRTSLPKGVEPLRVRG